MFIAVGDGWYVYLDKNPSHEYGDIRRLKEGASVHIESECVSLVVAFVPGRRNAQAADLDCYLTAS